MISSNIPEPMRMPAALAHPGLPEAILQHRIPAVQALQMVMLLQTVPAIVKAQLILINVVIV